MLAKTVSDAADVSEEILLILNPVQKDLIKKECEQKKIDYSVAELGVIDADNLPRAVVRVKPGDKKLMKPTEVFMDYKRIN